MKQIQISTAVVILVVTVLLGGLSIWAVHRFGPYTGWYLMRDDTVIIQPGTALMQDYIGKRVNAADSFKIEITARAPLLIAYIPEEYFRRPLADALSDGALQCMETNVLQTTFDCPLDRSSSGYYLLMMDMRPAKQAAEGNVVIEDFLRGLGVRIPSAQPDQPVRNDVRVRYTYCTANCS